MSDSRTDIAPDNLPTSDGQLARAAVRGDRSAFDVLVGRYQRQVTAAAYRLLNNIDDAREVAQEAFLRAFRRLKSLDKPDRFGGWMMRIVVNQALNFRRGRALRRTDSLSRREEASDRGELNLPDPAMPTPSENASAAELRQNMVDAMGELPEKQRMALTLFSIQKLPQKQVAEILGTSVEAVKWHVFTARKKLKEKFRDYFQVTP